MSYIRIVYVHFDGAGLDRKKASVRIVADNLVWAMPAAVVIFAGWLSVVVYHISGLV